MNKAPTALTLPVQQQHPYIRLPSDYTIILVGLSYYTTHVPSPNVNMGALTWNATKRQPAPRGELILGVHDESQNIDSQKIGRKHHFLLLGQAAGR